MLNSGLSFIASCLQIEGALPIELTSRHTLRAATDTEIEILRRQIKRDCPESQSPWIVYESSVREECHGNGTTRHFEALPRDQWRYWVIAFEGTNNELHELECLLLLLPVDLEIEFTLMYDQTSQQGDVSGVFNRVFRFYNRYSPFNVAFGQIEQLTAAEISRVATLFQLQRDLPQEFEFIKTSMKSFLDLRSMPSHSPLLIVGLFSIIESLITHAPRLTETLDSINHQITNKITLLRKFYSRQVLPQNYFQDSSEAAIWKKMYSYRSSVAHGTPVDFHKDLRPLKDRETVVLFLRNNIIELLILALNRPDLISDLRKC